MPATLAAAVLLALPQGPSPVEVRPERLRATLEELCAIPRLAGSEGGRAGADYAAEAFAAAGLRVERARYTVHAPRQTGQGLALVAADGSSEELPLAERGYAEDPQSLEHQVPPMHGLTAAGRARGRVVFAGRGREADFAALREAGVELEGTIALVRYGGLYRGLKVANAEAAGCAGALLYTDRRDDGSARGEVLPRGRWRPDDGIQRGSVFNSDGDPTTPGWASVAGARRVPLDEAPGLVGIPSLPVSQANADRILAGAGPLDAPQALDTVVEFFVEQDPAPVEIENVIGWIDGSDRSEEWVIAGAHRDAWGYGAVDNGSGTTVLLETARVLGAALERGWRPRRSIALATWDAEEWGLVGSTEWVEQHRSELAAHGVAYLNMDVVASGPSFGASCSPGMAALLQRSCAAAGVEPPASLGVPGGGSDHVPFLELAGMEVAAFGFHGGHGTYHSHYDSPYAVETFLDPGFAHHASAADLLVRMLDELGRGEGSLDGLAGWARQARGALEGLELPAGQKALLLAAADELVEAAAAAGEVPHPQRFLRFFLPPQEGGRLILWRTEGYGAAWFPDVRPDAGEELRDPGTLAAVAALRRAARSLQNARTPASR